VVEQDLASGQLAPVEGASITVVGGAFATTTDSSGFFELTRLPLGTLTIDVQRGQRGSRPPARKRLSGIQIVSSGMSVGLGTIQLNGTGAVRGRVALADDARPSAAEGSLVVVSETAFRGTVEHDGTFVLAGLPEGTFDLAAIRIGYDPGRFPAVDVAAGPAPKDLGSITLARATHQETTISNKVVLVGEMSSAGVSVSFISESDPNQVFGPVRSTSDGSYTIGLPVGAVVRGHFTKPGFHSVDLPGVIIDETTAIGLVPAYLSPITDCNLGCSIEPVIYQVAPTRAAVGQLVRIYGDGFDPIPANNLVRFGAGAGGPALLVTLTSSGAIMEVTIPPGAVSGQLTVINSGGSATSSESVSIVPPPRIVGVSPSSTIPGASVTVSGTGFGEGKLSVVVGTRSVTISSGPNPDQKDPSLVDFSFVLPAVPPGLETIAVSSLAGTASATISVLAPPYITGLQPTMASAGANLAIDGVGFSVLATDPMTSIHFAPGLSVSPGVITDRRMTVLIPASAVSGPISVVAPSLGVAIMSPGALDIVQSLPGIVGTDPSIGAPGETVTIRGINLHSPPERTLMGVSFTGPSGPLPAQVTSENDGQVDVIVPAGVVPGPITVQVASTSTIHSAVSEWMFRVITVTATSVPLLYPLAGFGLSAHEDQIFAIDTRRTGYVFDAATLVQTDAPSVLPYFDSNEPESFDVAPSGTRGLAVDGFSKTISLVVLPSFTLLSTCPIPAQAQSFAIRGPGTFLFDRFSATAYALALRGVVRVRYTGDVLACDMLSGASQAYDALGFDDVGQRLAFDTATPPYPINLLDLGSGSTTATLSTAGNGATAIRFDPGQQILWAFGLGGASGLSLSGGPSVGLGSAPALPSYFSQGGFDQSANGRWIYDSSCNESRQDFCIFDLVRREAARHVHATTAPDAFGGHGIVRARSQNLFFALTQQVNTQLLLESFSIAGDDSKD
jgi:hypothetical protein